MKRRRFRPRRIWTDDEIALLRARYPHEPTYAVAEALKRPVGPVYAKASGLGLHKSAVFLAGPHSGRLRPDHNMGGATRFPKGHVPANKGSRRPGWYRGRMRETWFKKGGRSKRWDPDLYAVGALRENADGYVDIKLHDGYRPWKQLHRVLWEDAHGTVPPGFALVFKNGDKLDVCLENLEIIPRAELMRRNTIHRLPAALKSTIQVLGQLKRRICEKQDRGSARSSLRHA